MKQWAADDIEFMLNTQDFGIEVIYRPGILDQTVNAIFDVAPVEVDTGADDAPVIRDQRPVLYLYKSDVSGIQVGHEFTVEGKLYSVFDIEDDNEGVLGLILDLK